MTTKHRLFLIGAGSLARELANWIQLDPGQWKDYQFSGFLSDDPNSLSAYSNYPIGIVGSIADYQPLPDDRLVMGIADPKIKMQLAADLLYKGAVFVNFVHSSVILSGNVKLGQGVVLCPNVIVSCDATVGDFVIANLGSTVGHDVKIGRGSTLSAHVDLTGFVELEEGVFLGSHASILPHAKVGAYAKVGAGSVVLKKVLPGVTVMGVPARQILL